MAEGVRKKGFRKQIQRPVDLFPTLVVPILLACAACRARKVEGRCCLFFLRGSPIAALLSECLEVPRRLAASVHIMPFSMSKAYIALASNEACIKSANLRSPPPKLKRAIFGLFDASMAAHHTSNRPTHPLQAQAAHVHG